MARLLLIPLAMFCLVAALLPVFIAALSAQPGAVAAWSDPRFAAALPVAYQGAGIVAGASLLFGLIGSLALRGAGSGAKIVAGALAILVLLAPAARYAVLPARVPPNPALLLPVLGAVTRGTALTLLVLTVALARVPASLAKAARAAGARPLQAWRHAVLAPLLWPLAVAAALAFFAGLAEGPAAMAALPHFDLARAWMAPAGLLGAAVSAIALLRLLRRSWKNKEVFLF
jgi:ABC-type spermidine/putrescine transport system permease subunit II